MLVKYSIITFCVPFFLACNIQFETPGSFPEEPAQNTESKQQDAPKPLGWEDELLTFVNEIRASGCRCGSKNMPPVPALKLHTALNEAAQIHADDMYQNRFFNHTGSDGSKVSDRAKRVGFDWMNIGENISNGYPTTESAFTGWKNSSGHCKNMMSSSFKYMGAANKGTYWVQTFGRTR
jgi:uncharacterized protein YkwD